MHNLLLQSLKQTFMQHNFRIGWQYQTWIFLKDSMVINNDFYSTQKAANMKKLVSILSALCLFIISEAQWLFEDERKDFGDTRLCWSPWLGKTPILTNIN